VSSKRQRVTTCPAWVFHRLVCGFDSRRLHTEQPAALNRPPSEKGGRAYISLRDLNQAAFASLAGAQQKYWVKDFGFMFELYIKA
jgi:hypothetical protein